MSKGFYGFIFKGKTATGQDAQLPKHESLEEHRKHCKAKPGNCPFEIGLKRDAEKASKEDDVSQTSGRTDQGQTDKPYGDIENEPYQEHIPHGVDLVDNLMCHIYKDGRISLAESGEYLTGYIDVGGDKDAKELAREIVEKYARSSSCKKYSEEEWKRHRASGFFDNRVDMVADMIEKARKVEPVRKDDYAQYALGNGVKAFADYMAAHPDGLTDEQKAHAANLVKYGEKEHEYASDVAPWFAQHADNLDAGQKAAVDQLNLVNDIANCKGWEHSNKYGIMADEIAEYVDVFKAAEKGELKKAKGMPDYIDTIGKCKAMILSRLEDCNFHAECAMLEEGKFDELLKQYK